MKKKKRSLKELEASIEQAGGPEGLWRMIVNEYNPKPTRSWVEFGIMLRIRRDGIREELDDLKPGHPKYAEKMIELCGYPDFKTYYKKEWNISQRRANELIWGADMYCQIHKVGKYSGDVRQEEGGDNA